MSLTHEQRSERRQQIAERLKTGEEAHLIAKEFGVSHVTVWRAAKENGIVG